MQVPRTGSPLSPVFTNVNPVMFSTDGGVVIPFTDAQTDSNVGFAINTWRIGNSSTTGNGDISYTNITIGNPTDAGDYALWPAPTAMSASPAYINVPVRYKNSLGVVTQASVARVQLVFADPGANGLDGPSVDISGYTSFAQNPGGAFTPTTATLSAVTPNVTSPTYAWTISGATPTSATTASVVVTPTSVSTGVTVTLTVNGSNLLSPISKTVILPVVYDGVPGTAGANGLMSAFPSIYIWTGASVPPTRPSTTSTYTWSTGAYTAPTLWATQPPTNTTAGNYLWEITVPLNVTATTTTSTLDWTNTTYAIRAIAYNGINGTNGTNGTSGTNGAPGAATFVITRTANDSSAPTNAEVSALLGRNPVAGDICTVSYNAGNNAVVYRYVTTWTLFQTYITGSLIVQNTITSDKLSVSQLSAISANIGTITAGDLSIGSSPAISGTTMTGTGSHLYSNGNFAFGKSTTNMVFDGANVYLNGFTNSNISTVTNANSAAVGGALITPTAWTTSKASYAILQFSGILASWLFNATYTSATRSTLRLTWYIRNTANTFSINNLQINGLNGFLFGIALSSPYNRVVQMPYSFSVLVNLPADTYNVYIDTSNDFWDSSGTFLGTNGNSTRLDCNFFAYQAQI
jgi:hypothetical protein